MFRIYRNNLLMPILSVSAIAFHFHVLCAAAIGTTIAVVVDFHETGGTSSELCSFLTYSKYCTLCVISIQGFVTDDISWYSQIQLVLGGPGLFLTSSRQTNS